MKKVIVFGVLGIVLLLSSFYFASRRDTALERDLERYNKFEEVKAENDNSYIYIDILAYTDEYFTLVYRNNTPYVLKLNKIGNFEEDELLKKTTRLVGVSKAMDATMKEKIVAMHNGSFEDELEAIITTDDVESIYGKYYLEVTKVVDDNKLPNTPETLRELTQNIGIALLIMAAFTLVIVIKKGKSE